MIKSIHKKVKNIKKGNIYYLVGASGSGKDSILKYFRQYFLEQCKSDIIVAHRYITRESDSNENSVFLTTKEFELRLKKQLLALHWQANSHQYGIGIELNDWLKSGVSVVVNGSRAHLPDTIEQYKSNIYSISVEVSDEILMQRLLHRSRESEQAIRERMQRHKKLKQMFQADHVILNESSIEDAAKQLKNIIEQTEL